MKFPGQSPGGAIFQSECPVNESATTVEFASEAWEMTFFHSLALAATGCGRVVVHRPSLVNWSHMYSSMGGQAQTSLRSPNTLFSRPTEGQNLWRRTQSTGKAARCRERSDRRPLDGSSHARLRSSCDNFGDGSDLDPEAARPVAGAAQHWSGLGILSRIHECTYASIAERNQ